MAQKFQLIGLCRFSYASYAGSGFASGDRVYDADRLARRLALFKKFWIPSVQGQTDKRFRIIILTGHGLPQDIRSQLEGAVSSCPGVHIETEADGLDHGDVCHKVLKRHRDPDADIVGEFSLDDDDALSLDFVSEVHRYLGTMSALLDECGRAELDFSRGFAAQIDSDVVRVKEVVAPHWNCGQVIFQKTPSRLSLFKFHHYRFWKKHPCLLAAQKTMFVRCFHGTNDSGDRWAHIKAENLPLDPSNIPSIFADRFGLTLISEPSGTLRIRLR